MSAIGLRIGSFQVLERVHIPEPGDWYLAGRVEEQGSHSQRVFMRLLGASPSLEALGALQHGYERLQAIADPHIPAAVGFYEGFGALAVQAGQGTPLHNLVQLRASETLPMAPPTLIDLGRTLCQTLAAVHQQGAVHGHLSAHNVVLSPTGHLWVWGIAQGPQTHSHAQWVAPECAASALPTKATDQWALGALLASVIVGQVPLPTGVPGDYNHAGFVHPVAEQWLALGQVLGRMTDPNPAARYPSMQAVLDAWEALAAQVGGDSARTELANQLQAHQAGHGGPEPSVPSPPTATHHQPPAAPTQEASLVEGLPSMPSKPPFNAFLANVSSSDSEPVTAVIPLSALATHMGDGQEGAASDAAASDAAASDAADASSGERETEKLYSGAHEPKDGALECETEKLHSGAHDTEKLALKAPSLGTPPAAPSSAALTKVAPLSAGANPLFLADDDDDDDDDDHYDEQPTVMLRNPLLSNDPDILAALQGTPSPAKAKSKQPPPDAATSDTLAESEPPEAPASAAQPLPPVGNSPSTSTLPSETSPTWITIVPWVVSLILAVLLVITLLRPLL